MLCQIILPSPYHEPVRHYLPLTGAVQSSSAEMWFMVEVLLLCEITKYLAIHNEPLVQLAKAAVSVTEVTRMLI